METINKTVKIMHKAPTSAYVKKNIVNLEIKSRIGASIRNGGVNKGLTSGEEAVMLPSLVGKEPSDLDWVKSVNGYWNGITVLVPIKGLDLDISWTYDITATRIKSAMKELVSDSKRVTTDKLNVKLVDASNSKFPIIEGEKEDASNIRKKEFIKKKDARVTELKSRISNVKGIILNSSKELAKYVEENVKEEEKYKYGTPARIDNYVIWRYALVYRDVANTPVDINKSNHIRFYIRDAALEQKVVKEKHDVKVTAMKHYISILEDATKMQNICLALDITGDDLEVALEDYVNNNQQKFITAFEDKNLQYKAFINRLVNASILRRIPNTDIITNDINEVIGNNLSDTITYIKNDANKQTIGVWDAKLHAIK